MSQVASKIDQTGLNLGPATLTLSELLKSFTVARLLRKALPVIDKRGQASSLLPGRLPFGTITDNT